MKTYSVKEIAEMLNTNPETVRRWIRDKKLDATIESKKGGHIVYEAALHEFLKSSPKYAAAAKVSLAGAIAGAAVLPTVMVSGLIAQKLIDAEQLKKARISNKDVVNFLRGEREITPIISRTETPFPMTGLRAIPLTISYQIRLSDVNGRMKKQRLRQRQSVDLPDVSVPDFLRHLTDKCCFL